MKFSRSIGTIAILVLSSSLSACSTLNQLDNVGKEPPLQKVELAMTKNNYEPVEWDDEADEHLQPRYANSLWQQGARAFFKDMKARRIGDILKVTVKIKDKAEIDNSTSKTRSAAEASDAPSLFGVKDKLLDLVPGSPASLLLDVASDGSSSGTGTIDREEIIETEIASMVTQILPNGNLVIHGDQEIRVNFEVRKITVDGIVRQEDISADNSIDSNQIAEARISYGGRGQITNMQQPRYGTQILDIISPF